MSNRPWLRHYPAEVPPTCDYPDHNLAEFLVRTAERNPNHTALEFMGASMSYGTLLDAVYRYANAMISLGLRKGDRVAVMLPNCPQAVIAYYGSMLAGGVVVMTNPLYMPRELEHQLNDAGARFIVTLDLLVGRVRQATEGTPMERIIVTSVSDYLPFPKNLLYPIKAKKDGTPLPKLDFGDTQLLRFTKLLREALSDPCRVPVQSRTDLALIQYTGGTTGFAKGVMLTHRNMIANTIQAHHWNYRNKGSKDKYLAALPFFHVFGMTVLLNQGVRVGATLYLMPRFEINAVLKAIQKHRLTLFPGAPTMYVALINHPDVSKYDLSSIDVCISGAAALPLEVQERFEKLTGGKLIEGYGLTEAAPVTHANNIWELRKAGSVGIPIPDTEARIVHPESGEDVEPGDIGEVIVRGPQVMAGYWRRPEETAKTLKDGWLYTGDLARMDSDGFFYILDRRKDLIIAGGFNIYPREVEEVLFEHPDIEEAIVAGVNDPYRGETVKAYIVLKSGASEDPEALKQWCKERLAVYKVPRIYEFRSSLPKTLVGKVLRRKLLEEEQEREQTTNGEPTSGK
ncbi:long-chain fatty acid--CoA ligase [Paenibacillus pasadenensis]|uniref:long-chain-fatty-acid--CoA ligase n=1 Tax=Paenibacillus pasadenensis TaxID=217090 RepID=UPI00203E77AC|nr:long-chain fatty acid--CoA ligase [Paenibacillus pasadenensis]MCM3745800.1 long-chain fatty acid--CoA ligase [Paenibacillus pasadenensis]